MAYSDLLLACQEEVAFGVVDKAMMADLPEGCARMVWLNLTARFGLNTAAAKIELKREFTKSSLGEKDKDPDKWVSDLERIRQRL